MPSGVAAAAVFYQPRMALVSANTDCLLPAIMHGLHSIRTAGDLRSARQRGSHRHRCQHGLCTVTFHNTWKTVFSHPSAQTCNHAVAGKLAKPVI